LANIVTVSILCSFVVISLVEHVYIFLNTPVALWAHIELTMMYPKDADGPNRNRSGETDRAQGAECRCYPKSWGMQPTGPGIAHWPWYLRTTWKMEWLSRFMQLV